MDQHRILTLTRALSRIPSPPGRLARSRRGGTRTRQPPAVQCRRGQEEAQAQAEEKEVQRRHEEVRQEMRFVDELLLVLRLRHTARPAPTASATATAASRIATGNMHSGRQMLRRLSGGHHLRRRRVRLPRDCAARMSRRRVPHWGNCCVTEECPVSIECVDGICLCPGPEAINCTGSSAVTGQQTRSARPENSATSLSCSCQAGGCPPTDFCTDRANRAVRLRGRSRARLRLHVDGRSDTREGLRRLNLLVDKTIRVRSATPAAIADQGGYVYRAAMDVCAAPTSACPSAPRSRSTVPSAAPAARQLIWKRSRVACGSDIARNVWLNPQRSLRLRPPLRLRLDWTQDVYRRSDQISEDHAMDSYRFDALTRSLTVAGSRRRALAAALGGLITLGALSADAKKGKRAKEAEAERFRVPECGSALPRQGH